MNVPPIQPIKPQPTFQMKWKQRQLTNLTLTSITLDNGDRLVTRQTDTYKLQSLYNKLGQWIKSKLIYFSDNKPYKVIRCENTNVDRITGNKFNSK